MCSDDYKNIMLAELEVILDDVKSLPSIVTKNHANAIIQDIYQVMRHLSDYSERTI